MTDREQLAARIEAAEKNGAALFRDAAVATYHDRLMPIEDGRRWIERFDALLNAGAYLDAAMMLVGERKFTLQNHGDVGGKSMALVEPDIWFRSAATPALALAAAAIRAGGA